MINKIRQNLNKIIIGKEREIEYVLMALLSRSHILVVDVPGTGKTTLAKALAKTIDGEFQRVQFTPDLLPTDIVGNMVYNAKESTFHFRKGPIFANVMLADEINRASPRTQSALLEAMGEGQVTSDRERHKLPVPFMVIATENPIEFQGTYPLPEAQLDRFGIQLELGYPQEEEEYKILIDRKLQHPLELLKPVITSAELFELQKETDNIKIDKSISEYIIKIVRSTRTDARLQLGASTRASLTLSICSRAWALLQKRDYVIPDDVKDIVIPILKHRIILDTKAKYAGITPEEIIKEILDSTAVPV
ncbi:MAG: MoxR family ATPase [Verrucomicrobiota bacterium]|nr:MoxR family ATPase [Verrucomicrobiota bacterium]